ncbi:MAG: Tetratricopeptide repeat-containing protein [Firmicutes bacterium]|nr:Tetratricopeptide repeat-containing protein [Bacillota bacterium]
MILILVAEAREGVDLQGSMRPETAKLSGVNWEREFALIIDMGEQRTGGYAVQVTGVNLGGGDEINVDLNITKPGPGSFVAQVVTHPYAVARIPRVGLRPGTITVTARNQAGAEVARHTVTL